MIAVVGFSGLSVLVVAWLVVSFSQPSPRRTSIEWIGACGMYLALLMFFVHLAQRAQEAESTVALIAFGFLVMLFGSGLVVSLVNFARSFRSRSIEEASATN